MVDEVNGIVPKAQVSSRAKLRRQRKMGRFKHSITNYRQKAKELLSVLMSRI